MVAKFGEGRREVRAAVSPLPGTAVSSTCSSTSAVEMAIETMGKATHGLCRSCKWQDDTDSDRHSL